MKTTMANQQSNKKRIAKNTIMLWTRMLLSIIVSFYTSRVVLQTLGVEDYGIYGVVGGIVAMFSFLNASMAGATSRFLTYEMGQGNDVRLKDTFSSALVIHLGLALLVLVLAETVGLWFLSNKLVIPEGRMFAAHCVYQFTIISMMVGFTQVPYTATIIAHEKMDIYAYIELANVGLKLGIVYLLVIGNFDKLILYGFLVMLVTILTAMASRTYCVWKFREAHFHWVWRPQIMRPMLSFSGWDLYGNMSASTCNQGSNFLLNIFFGSRVNAAAGIAIAIQGILTGLAFNITTAFRPQIIKAYAKGNIKEANNLLQMGIKFAVGSAIFLTIPIYWEINYILKLWLCNVPQFTIEFIRVILICIPLQVINIFLCIPIHAYGNIKRLSFITGSVYLLTLLPIYICFKMGSSPVMAYVITFFSYIFILLSNNLILRYQLNIRGIGFFLLLVVVLNIMAIILISIIIIGIQELMDSSFTRLFVTLLTSCSVYCIIFYYIFLDRSQRHIVIEQIKSKLHF